MNKILNWKKFHFSFENLPGKTSMSDDSQVELISMPIEPQKWSISNHSHGQTIRQVVMNYWFDELVCHQLHPSFDKRINLARIMRKPISVVQPDHLDCNCCQSSKCNGKSMKLNSEEILKKKKRKKEQEQKEMEKKHISIWESATEQRPFNVIKSNQIESIPISKSYSIVI